MSLFGIASGCLVAVEDAYGPGELPERRYVADGEVAWDCEQVTVRVTRTFGHSGNLLADQSQLIEDLIGLGAEVQIQIVRCAPALDDDGTAPSPADIETSAVAVLGDSDQVVEAITEAVRLHELPGCSGVAFVSWTGSGPAGGFVGGTTTLRLDLS